MQMGFSLSIKKNPPLYELRNYEQSNSQILSAKVWKPYPDEKFQSFVNRYFSDTQDFSKRIFHITIMLFLLIDFP